MIHLLRTFDVGLLVDIRTVRRSRRNPQFDADTFAAALRESGIGYVALPALGGLRRAREDSPNTGWRNASFRAYADHMLTPEFEAGIVELHGLASRATVALMCAEAVPWRCHRSLVADALTVRGALVEHIIGPAGARPHRLTPFARVHDLTITYPATDDADDRRLETFAPFHLEATVRVLQRRPTHPVEIWEGDRYVRAMPTDGGMVVVDVENRGTVDLPDLRYEVRTGDVPAGSRARIVAALRRSLGLDVDPGSLRAFERDPKLGPLAVALRGMRPPRFSSLFETFCNVIPFQQLSLDAGIAIVGRLVEAFGPSVDSGGRRLRGAPTAEVVAGAPLDRLRACGLTARKADALRHLARAIADGELVEDELARLPAPEAIRLLDARPGVGPWTAALVLLRGLGRLDVFPPGDVGASRGLAAVLGTKTPAALERAIEGYGATRGFLYFYALAADLRARGLIRSAGPGAGPAAG